jgi:hypothetical protein
VCFYSETDVEDVAADCNLLRFGAHWSGGYDARECLPKRFRRERRGVLGHGMRDLAASL